MTDQPPSFLEELRQPRPDPGGGAAAAYGACVGLALLEKIVRLEQNRQRRLDENTADWTELLLQVKHLTMKLNDLRKKDVQAYLSLTAARSAARSESHYRERLAAAVEEVLGCPTDILKNCLSAAKLASDIGEHCRKHLLADLLVAGELLTAAGAGAHHIASANLPLLHEPAARTRHRKVLAELKEQLLATRQGFNSEKNRRGARGQKGKH